MGNDRETTTSISHVTPDRIMVRGFDLAHEVIGSTGVAEYFYILLTGSRPRTEQVQILDACIVAIAEHGLVPSVQAARMTYAAGPEAFHGAVAAGLLGCGSVILGSTEAAGEFLAAIAAAAADQQSTVATAAAAVRDLRASGRTVPGFGHPVHRMVDPRATALLGLGKRLGTCGVHVASLEAVDSAAQVQFGRRLVLNASGAIAALLLDVGFPLGALKGVPLIGRTMSLVAHLLEEKVNPLGFSLADAAEKSVTFETVDNETNSNI